MKREQNAKITTSSSRRRRKRCIENLTFVAAIVKCRNFSLYFFVFPLFKPLALSISFFRSWYIHLHILRWFNYFLFTAFASLLYAFFCALVHSIPCSMFQKLWINNIYIVYELRCWFFFAAIHSRLFIFFVQYKTKMSLFCFTVDINLNRSYNAFFA